MMIYRLSFFSHGKLIYRGDHECMDDLEAMDLAKEFSKDFDVEVSQGDRVVVRLKMANATAK